MKNNHYLILLVFFLGIFSMNLNLVFAQPSGATVNMTRTEHYVSAGGSDNISAMAGNISVIDVFGASTTQTWQGFVGNVSGGFSLSDSEGSIFYNWTGVNAVGEVYASTNNTVNWDNIQCFNYTALGNYSDDNLNGGNTSLYGTNLSQLESLFSIEDMDVDGVNETFNRKDHRQFYTSNLEFTEGECWNTAILNSTGSGVFEEVLLYSPNSQAVIFTSILMENEVGYNGDTYDFGMLVLDDGHGTDVAATPYYFYLELG